MVAIVAGIAGDNGSTLLLFVSLILGFVAGMVYQGMVVSLVRDVQDGRRDLSAGELYRTVTPVLGTLIVASIVFGIAIGDRLRPADRPRLHPADDLGGDRAGDRDRAPQRLRRRRPLARAGPRQRLAGLRHRRSSPR